MSEAKKSHHEIAADITIAVIEKAALERRNGGDGTSEVTIAHLAAEAAKAYKVIYKALMTASV